MKRSKQVISVLVAFGVGLIGLRLRLLAVGAAGYFASTHEWQLASELLSTLLVYTAAGFLVGRRCARVWLLCCCVAILPYASWLLLKFADSVVVESVHWMGFYVAIMGTLAGAKLAVTLILTRVPLTPRRAHRQIVDVWIFRP